MKDGRMKPGGKIRKLGITRRQLKKVRREEEEKNTIWREE